MNAMGFHTTVVLIGTLWNVNFKDPKKWEKLTSFNRYIVECK